MELYQKSENTPSQISESQLYFQGPPLKRWSSDPTSRARKPCTIGIAESERKTRLNFPELFHQRDRDWQCIEQYSLQSETPLLFSDIPYKVQHSIIGAAQNILEHCCYEFARQWLPSKLNDRGWDCAEAAELTEWTRVIIKYSERLPSDAFATGRNLPNDVLASVRQLRHTAVHRLRTTVRGVSRLIQNAQKFTEVLKDSARTLQLGDLYREIGVKIETEPAEYALNEGITAMLQSELDGNVLQGYDCSLEEELTVLHEILPIPIRI